MLNNSSEIIHFIQKPKEHIPVKTHFSLRDNEHKQGPHMTTSHLCHLSYLCRDPKECLVNIKKVKNNRLILSL